MVHLLFKSRLLSIAVSVIKHRTLFFFHFRHSNEIHPGEESGRRKNTYEDDLEITTQLHETLAELDAGLAGGLFLHLKMLKAIANRPTRCAFCASENVKSYY